MHVFIIIKDWLVYSKECMPIPHADCCYKAAKPVALISVFKRKDKQNQHSTININI